MPVFNNHSDRSMQNQGADPFYRSRRACFQRLELDMVQRHDPVLDGGPSEARILKPLAGHHKTGAVPIELLQPIRPARAKDKHRAGEQILAQRR
nr:hypothetical protein [Pseudooceanicola spongiae]